MAQIFISYAREDSARVKALHQRLKEAGFEPWLDREHIVPGQQWEPVLKRALKGSDFVLVCLSETSINKRGFLRKEIKQALEQAQEKFEDDVYLIPARLDDCAVPDILEHLQWVDLFEDYGWDELLGAFEVGLRKLGKPFPQPPAQAQPPQQPTPAPRVEPPRPAQSQPARPTTPTPKPTAPDKIVLAAQFSENLNGVPLEMLLVPGGKFLMGSPEGTGYDSERPQHEVIVPAFYCGKFQVTQAQWQAVMGDNPSRFTGDLKHPVECVSWEDAQAFCKKLRELTGQAYRLPTEAEWEYACRAGTTGDYAGELEAMAWYYNNSGSTTHPVGQKQANKFGLYDMHGNVWEWCEDVWHSDYKGAPMDGSAWLSGGDSSSRVLRGGAFNTYVVSVRSADRGWYAPGDRNYHFGLRVALSARTP